MPLQATPFGLFILYKTTPIIYMRRYILTLLLIACAAVTTMAQDSYNEKVEKLIWSGYAEEISKEYIEKAENSIAKTLMRNDSISEEEAKKNAHDFFENDYLPSVIEISRKHITGNLTEEQIDEILAEQERPEAQKIREHINEACAAMKDSSLMKSLRPIIPQIMQGEITELPLDGVSEEYIAKYNQANSFYDITKPIKQAMQTAFSAFDIDGIIKDEKFRSELNNTISFITNNINRMGIYVMYGHVTEADLDWIISFYSKPSRQAYAKAMEAIIDEVMSVSTKKIFELMEINKKIEAIKTMRKTLESEK